MKFSTLITFILTLSIVISASGDNRSSPAVGRIPADTPNIVLRDSLLRLPSKRVSSSMQKRNYTLEGVSMEFAELVENIDVPASLVAKPVGWVMKQTKPQLPKTQSYVVSVSNKSSTATKSTAYLAVLVTAVPMSKLQLPVKEQDKFREVLQWAGQPIPAPFEGNSEQSFEFFKQWKMPGGFGSFNTAYFSKRFEVYLVTEPIVGQ